MLFIYTSLEALIGLIIGLYVALFTKKASHVVYGKLDRIGQITNILLVLIYLRLAPLYLFLGVISNPAYDGFLGILGWIVSIIIASASFFCSIGIGYSIALRKQGKSKLSFIVQFAGLLAIGIIVLLYNIFTGNLLQYLN